MSGGSKYGAYALRGAEGCGARVQLLDLADYDLPVLGRERDDRQNADVERFLQELRVVSTEVSISDADRAFDAGESHSTARSPTGWCSPARKCRTLRGCTSAAITWSS